MATVTTTISDSEMERRIILVEQVHAAFAPGAEPG